MTQLEQVVGGLGRSNQPSIRSFDHLLTGDCSFEVLSPTVRGRKIQKFRLPLALTSSLGLLTPVVVEIPKLVTIRRRSHFAVERQTTLPCFQMSLAPFTNIRKIAPAEGLACLPCGCSSTGPCTSRAARRTVADF